MARLLLIKPLEPLSLSRKQITSPLYYQPTPATFALPQPTTVLGTLGAILGIKINKANIELLEDINIVSKEVAKRLECTSPLMRGPVLLIEHNWSVFVPLKPNLYVNLDHLSRVLLRKRDGYILETGICYEESFACIEPSYMVLTGVSLKRIGVSGEKTVRLGYMYKYPIVFYREMKTGRVVEAVTAYVLNCMQDVEDVCRVGGEKRVAKLKTVEDEARVDNRFFNPDHGLSKGDYVAVSYVPIIPSTNGLVMLSIDSVHGLEFLGSPSDIIGVPKEGASPPKVAVEKVGLGYSEATGRRRPTVLALPPGTVIRAPGGLRKEPIELVRTLWNIGYSTLLRIS